MIPQITEINFPSYATLNSATITLSEMGDRNITTQIKIDGDIVPDFSGWELEFKGERFILPVKEPQAAKDNTSRRSIVDLTFSSWAVQEMKRYFFVEMTSIESGTAIADKYKASLGLNIENFVTAFNNVLNYYFNGNIEMDLFGSGTGIYSAEPAFFEIDYTHIWDVLQKIYEIYQVRWTITYDSSNEKYVIKVGYPAAEIDDHEFEYGYKGGLLRFERQVQDYDITNVLLGRGGEKNLPYRYFKKVDPQNPNWAGDPDAIPELKNIYFENLRDINFRRYVQGWETNPNRILEEGDVVETYDSARGETDFAYAKGHTDERFNPVEYVKDDASIAIYGERWGALDNADDIYPTIQGIEVDPYGRIDQVVDVEDVTTDDIEAMAADAAEITNVAGVSRTEWIDSNSTLTLDINGTDFIVPEGKVGNLTFVHTWFDTISYGKRGNDQVNIDPSDAVNELVGINTTLSYVTVVNRSSGTEYPPAGIPAGNYFYKLHIVVKSEFEPSMYNSVEVTVGVDGLKLTTSEGNANAWKPTFDIWVKNIWNTTQQSGESDEQYAARVWEPILGDRTGEEAKIAFSTGFLSLSEDYNFTIASIPVVDRTKTIDGVASEWRITLIKSDAEYEATGKYIPNSETGGNASAGDYFFFTGIDMPWAYVLWAEEKLNAYKTAELAKLKQINPTWIIRIDKVRANTKEQGELEYLANRFASGAKLRVRDKRFTNNQVLTLYVQTVTYTWQEPSNGNPYLVPDIEVVLSDKVETVASPIDQLEGSVDLIQSTYAKISDIESAIRRVASPIFLKKTGESERSLSPTRFSSLMASESFRQGDIGGQGWGAYTDGEGHSVLEADTIVVRKDMRVNTLTVNQIAYLGGKQIISAAAMECNRVEVVDGGYKCYFDQKQGSVANLFKVDDVVLGQVWNADESELRYYKRKVIAIDSDSITLSSTIADGTGIPQPKDVLVQYGSYSDTSRQYVIVRDVIGGGYERMLSGLTTVFSNGEEYYFAGRQDGSTPRWFVGDANGQHASYQDGVLNITGRLSVTTQVDKGNGTYESLSNYLSNLQDQIDGNIQTWYATGEPTLQNYPANTWPTVEDKNNHIGDLYYESETGKAYRFMLDGNTYKWVQIADEDIAAALALAQQNQTAIAGLAYLKAATNQGTLVQGGLVLTSMIQLGQTEEGVYKVYSGINGIMDTSALGNGIAAWYGGPMADIGADSTLTDFAKSLFRFDGSGYLASGNIKWDLNGNGEIPGISWNNGRITLSPDIYLQGGDRLTQIVDAVNRMYTQFAYDSHDNITVAPTHALYIPTTSPAYPIEGKVALYYDYNGNYSELPSGGVGEVFELTLRNGATLLGIFQPGVEDKTIDLSPMLSGYATQSWVSANFNKYVLPTASASVLGGIKIGTGLTIDATGVVSVTGQTQGTVTRVDLGTTQYSPNDSGVVTLPSYPTTLPASDVSAWAKKTSLAASDVPTLAISKISGLQDALDGKQPLDADLTAIAALTGSGLLRRNSNNTWSLDTNTYLTDYTIYPLTVKNSGGVTELTYNPKTASGEITLTKAMVGLGNVENTALSTWAGSNNITTLGTITTGVWHGSKIANAYLANSSVTINGKSVSLGGSVSLNLDDIGDGTSRTWDRIVFTDTVQTITGKKTMTNVSVTGYLAVPKIAPASPVTGDIYLWADADGNYSEIPGGGVADIYDLTVRKNGTSLGTYNLGEQAADINIPIGWTDLTEDSFHKFVSQSEKDTWSAKQNAISDLTTIRGNANKGATAYSWGDHSLAGYATPSDISTAISALGLGTASQKDFVTTIVSGGAGLPTADAIYTFVNNAVTAAQPYKGVSSTAITDGGTEKPTISGYTTRTKGDVVAYNKKEFIWEGDKWRELGDEGSYALKTVQVIAGTGLTGGGAISQDVTLSLSSATQASLALANSALQSSDMKALTLKVGSITVANNYDALTARTYTITKANLTGTIGTTTYAPYHADGYLPLSGGTLTGTLYTQHILPSSALGGYNIGSQSAPFGSGYFSGSLLAEESVETYDVIAHGTADLSVRLAIPTSAPTSPASGKTYLWASSLGEYAETPSGGGSATVYDLTIRKNGTAIGTYNLGTQAADVNIPVGWSDLTPDAKHRFLTDSLISTWNGKYTKPATGIPKTDLARAVQTSLGLADTALQSVPLATDTTIGGFKTGTGTYLDLANDGVLYVDVDGISTYMSDEGFLKSVAFSDLTSHPTTLAGYGITDAASASDLTGYLPLSAGSGKALTGDLYINGSGATRQIWWKDANNNTVSVATMFGDGNLGIGYFQQTINKNTIIRGYNIRLYTGSSSKADAYQIEFDYAGNFYPLSGSIKLGAASKPWSAVYATTLYGNLDWSYIQNKPTLDNIADGTTRKLSNYLPLTGGTLTGGLTLSNVNQVFDVSTTTRSIYYKASDAVSYRGIMFGTNGDLTIGYDGPSHSRSLYLDGFNEYLRFGATKQYSVKLNSTGTVELSGISAVLPVTTNEVNLGSSAKAFNNIYGKLDLSYVQSASDLKAIEALTGTGLAKRTADNTWELTDTADKAEELATFSEEDAMFTYRQVPSEAVGDVLKATAVKGKSIVWNQLFSKGGSVSAWGVTLTHNDDGSYTISGTASASGTIYMTSSSNYIAHDLIGGHIHLIKEERISGSFSGNAKSAIRISGKGPVLWFATSSLEKSISTHTGQRYPYFVFNSGDSFTDYRFTLQAFDLTLMFGAGNEPTTVEEFEALFPLPYYDYNPGELVNNAASGVEMVGFNLLKLVGRTRFTDAWTRLQPHNFSEDKYIIGYTADDYYRPDLIEGYDITDKRVSVTSASPGYGIGFPIKCQPNTDYCIQATTSGDATARRYIGFYDNTGIWLGWRTGADKLFTTPDNCYWMVLCVRTESSNQTAIYEDICINISDPSLNGQYKPYKTSTLSTPITEIVPADKPTVRLNQLVGETATTTASLYGYTITRTATEITIQNVSMSTPTTGNWEIFPGLAAKIVSGHKYYIKSDWTRKYPSVASNVRLSMSPSGNIPQLNTIYTAASGITNVYFRVAIAIPLTILPVGGTLSCYIDLIDLTDMYGAGNEPTDINQIDELLGPDAIPYNTGEDIPNRIFPVGMKSAGSVADEWSGTTAIKRIGVVDLGTLNWSMINDTSYPNRFTITISGMANNGNNIIPNYANKGVGGYGSQIAEDKSYDTNSRLQIHDSAYATAADFKAAMAGVYLYYELATPVTYTTDQPLPGTLAAFESGGTQKVIPTYDIVSGGEKVFPDGPKYINESVYDEYYDTTAIKRVGVVDLGMLSWTRALRGANYFFEGRITDKKANSDLLCSMYVYDNRALSDWSYPDKTVNRRAPNNISQFFIRDDSYTDAASFRAAMSGVLLYYELAEPITYTLDHTLVQAPMVCDFQYGANMSDVAKAYLPLSGGTLTGALNSQNILPSATATYDLGSYSKRFKDLYLAGTATVNGIASSGNILASGEIRLSANNGKVVVEGLGGLFHYNDDDGDDFGLVYLGRQNGVEKIFVGTDDEYLDIVLDGHTYAYEADVANSLSIPTAAPSNPVSTKVYLYCDTTGNYYQS